MTRTALLADGVQRLVSAGIDTAPNDARRLLEKASGLDRTGLFLAMPDQPAPTEIAAFDAMIARRVGREPLSHILGSVGFWTLDLKVTRDVLTPRPDTETIVEAALEAISDRGAPLRILDIGTGSGALALALVSELDNAHAVATDISAPALAVARENACLNGLSERISFVETSWAQGVEGPFDLIVSNPPYIASAVLDSLDPEVRVFEPRLALDGGADGLEPYRVLLGQLERLLAPRGLGVFEIGFDQGESVPGLARAAGAHAELVTDLAGQDRAVRIRFDKA